MKHPKLYTTSMSLESCILDHIRFYPGTDAELIADEKARKEAIEKKLAKQKANKEKNALLIKQKKLEKLQKEVEDLKKK